MIDKKILLDDDAFAQYRAMLARRQDEASLMLVDTARELLLQLREMNQRLDKKNKERSVAQEAFDKARKALPRSPRHSLVTSLRQDMVLCGRLFAASLAVTW
jgi:hypothetical protein